MDMATLTNSTKLYIEQISRTSVHLNVFFFHHIYSGYLDSLPDQMQVVTAYSIN